MTRAISFMCTNRLYTANPLPFGSFNKIYPHRAGGSTVDTPHFMILLIIMVAEIFHNPYLGE